MKASDRVTGDAAQFSTVRLTVITVCVVQVTVKASDRVTGDAAQFSTVRLTVNVPRDEFSPVFSQNFSRSLSENIAVNSSVLTVHATDRDMKVGDSQSRSQTGT